MSNDFSQSKSGFKRMFIVALTALKGLCTGQSEESKTQAITPINAHNVVVSKTSFDSHDSYAVIQSNGSFLSALEREHFREDELSQDALRCYYADYYCGQIHNGGFSQFAYNTKWNATKIRYVREGLKAIGAHQHLQLFEESADILDRFTPAQRERYFDSEYFGENAERDLLGKFDDTFYKLEKTEDIVELNNKWLRSLPNLTVITIKEMQAEIDRRVAAMPNRERRVAEALAKEPRYKKLIRALCTKVGRQFDQITAGDPSYQYQGRSIIAWHFLTKNGNHCYMVDVGGAAIMFDGDTDKEIVRMDAPESL